MLAVLSSVNAGILAAGVLLLLSVFASKVSSRYGLPALVLFIAIGMLAGSEGFGGIHFDDYRFAYGIGVVALVLILFGGGLESNWSQIKPVVAPGLLLATLGVAITAGIVGLVALLVLGVTPLQGLLLGAIVASTDAAAVFGVLRAQQFQLKGKLTQLLEFESGSNDPMAIFLTFGITGLMIGELTSGWELLPQLVKELTLGAIGGVAVGRLAACLFKRLHLEYDGLYHVLTIAVAFLAFGGVQSLGGSGFLAVYVAGLTLGGKKFVHKDSLIQFHEGLGWLMQIVMFLALGLLAFPSELLEGWSGNVVLAAALIFVARPVAVFVCLAPFRQIHFRKKLFLSWGGLRGAVPIVLATIPLLQGVPGANQIFNAVFVIVILSVSLQATTIGWFARQLGVVVPERPGAAGRNVLTKLVELSIPATSPAVSRSLVELNLPGNTLLVLLTRGREAFIPHGSTVLEAGDAVLVQAHESHLEDVKGILLGTG